MGQKKFYFPEVQKTFCIGWFKVGRQGYTKQFFYGWPYPTVPNSHHPLHPQTKEVVSLTELSNFHVYLTELYHKHIIIRTPEKFAAIFLKYQLTVYTVLLYYVSKR